MKAITYSVVGFPGVLCASKCFWIRRTDEKNVTEIR